MERTRKSYSNDGDRDGGFKHLTHFQSQIGGSGTEYHRHHQSQRHRIGGHFLVLLVGVHHGHIFFALFKLPKSIFRNSDFVFYFVVVHIVKTINDVVADQ